jgi:hypothetical protein
MLLIEAGTRPTVLVAFAISGGIPRPISAGKVSSVPPPAIAFIVPATAEMAAMARS